ncbi:NAD dependent epimerase/dehydratase [Colletotrichum scovillei]|uniref:NAD dependent epimerase/dehydratase n=1 Tax=Colletotrichum scovillei TaxID=1209932 RepID=A0A9P7QTW9_9PEZI|nr:NAD dependent epimerase/dehydratase [Colletotrichum scovillei]KAG7043082.1 NAD dependent epimerase/dehydratase [Colletotrichum scovillei]
MVAQRLLITGSAGYIGGTVLAQLLKSTFSNVQALSVSALVRHQDQADLLAQKGVIPILFESLDETDVLRKLASEHDAVIHVTSGASNVAEFPISKQYRGTHVFSDKEDILSYEKSRDIEEPYINRTIDLMVAERGKGLGVETYSISPPLVFGLGTGYFKTLSGGQLPMLMRSALANGHAQYVGEGAGRWSHVHVQDLAALYEVILAKALSGEIPSNDRRIFFAETGSSSFLQTAKAIGKAGFALGALASAEPVSTSLEKVAQEIFHGQAQWAEIVIASEALVSAELSRECGWKPIKSEKDWEATFEEEFRLVIDVVAHQG